jgi:hypothetical protein
MRIRTNLFVSLDGKVAGPDGRPVQLLLPGFTGADPYGLPDVHLVGGPSTMPAFLEIDALTEVRQHAVPMVLGDGRPLSPAAAKPLSLSPHSTRTFPDGVVELGYLVPTGAATD